MVEPTVDLGGFNIHDFDQTQVTVEQSSDQNVVTTTQAKDLMAGDKIPVDRFLRSVICKV